MSDDTKKGLLIKFKDTEIHIPNNGIGWSWPVKWIIIAIGFYFFGTTFATVLDSLWKAGLIK